ncbi:glycoside hydrolase family 65 protein [Dokdonia sp. Hel_I_53]|uniref:glycoside hydrolase family 65 protein n=1 Tax=Dokdonia sp. Hel_I_53 TaxID=1566287 RepID=UPI00119BF213|nr:glycoside hydrolase family 65 protein [Dokdonia sp. Hel_I_53]TVZ52901.1 maltose phosphorylase [Dokdonia sp. Hel_I_53]
MHTNYIIPNPWSIIEEGWNPVHVKASESLMALGNGAMGQRANFEETYSGKTFQGSYIGGVYYPDKTRVGWWKNGYPEYFAKVLNAPSWIGINVCVNGENLDLATCKEVKNFKRELNMREGILYRSFTARLQNDIEIEVHSTRFLSLAMDEVGAIHYTVKPINKDVSIQYEPYLNSSITNEDSNWDDTFWNTLEVSDEEEMAFISTHTMKTEFYVCAFMAASFEIDGREISLSRKRIENKTYIGHIYETDVRAGEHFTISKIGGYVTSLNHKTDELKKAAVNVLSKAKQLGFDRMKQLQKNAWAGIWEMSDITIEGDVKAQQGIRFNIFHLNQTYTGSDSRLNIGPKGFTGEKYGGSTYWDTEAYCIPFYMATKDQLVARQLLKYRYDQLDKAIENAEKLGFKNGAALYPMVTMNGEECHNEWEITFEEIHRNGSMVYAIFNYERFTGDKTYIPEMGLEVIIAVARFWEQRATYSTAKDKYVILGVTGPNEYENNVNNNWFTNYLAKWCLEYAIEKVAYTKESFKEDWSRIINKTNLSDKEMVSWKNTASNMYFPFSEKHDVFLQQDGFLDKELLTVAQLPKSERPINQKWSWDRILRSPYIKQADTLQGFYFFEDHFSLKELEKHFDFYEPFTVHESSLSPCVHAIQAARLNRMNQAYAFYLRTSRLDLDDYNKEVEEGLHITSMAGTWQSVVEGFGGMRVQDEVLSFTPKIPQAWKSYSFKINFRGQILKVNVTKEAADFTLTNGEKLTILLNGEKRLISAS